MKQFVTIQAGGVIKLRSKELRAGAEAEVIVLVAEKSNGRDQIQKAKEPKQTRTGKTQNTRMTKQDRGDIAWAKRILAEPGPNIPWSQVKANRVRANRGR